MTEIFQQKEDWGRWHYVYQLIDPRDDSVFYIGKGYGKRWSSHAYHARRGKAGPRFDRIREILAAGMEVSVAIVGLFDSNEAARHHELRLIHDVGYENLTNGGVKKPFGPAFTKAWAIRRGIYQAP